MKYGMPVSLANIGTSLKLLFSSYLIVTAIGYGIALMQILLTHGLADGRFGLSIDDIVYSYYGNRSGTLMERKLNGSMKVNAPSKARFAIIQWVRNGAKEKDFAPHIKEIFERHCVVCHGPGNAMGIPDFTGFDQIKKRSKSDTGATFTSLTRVSHIHLFGISFIFMFVGVIFSLASGVPRKLKYIVIIMPYVFLLTDITSWWLTKINPHFAWLVLLGGVGLGLAFAFMWIVSMYEMWVFSRGNKVVDVRSGVLDE